MAKFPYSATFQETGREGTGLIDLAKHSFYPFSVGIATREENIGAHHDSVEEEVIGYQGLIPGSQHYHKEVVLYQIIPINGI